MAGSQGLQPAEGGILPYKCFSRRMEEFISDLNIDFLDIYITNPLKREFF